MLVFGMTVIDCGGQSSRRNMG